MKRINILTGLFLLSLNFIAQTKPEKKEDQLTWHTDIMKANEISAATNKPLFAFFTGSDWCVWCHRLQANVFAKPEFIKWANQNVVLVELDFPRGKSLSPELTQQNSRLQQTFQVQGYPTVWMFFLHKKKDVDGYDIEALGSLGYPQAEPGKEQFKFIAEGNALLKKKANK